MLTLALSFAPQLLMPAGQNHDRLNVCYPDQLLILEFLENTTQCRSAIGRSKHKRMNADGNDSGIMVGVSLGLTGQLGYIVDPQLLHITWTFRALKILPHVDCDCWIGNQNQRS